MDIEELKEITYIQCVENLRKKVNIFPKNSTMKMKIEKLNILVEFAVQKEKYEDCIFLKEYIDNLNPKTK